MRSRQQCETLVVAKVTNAALCSEPTTGSHSAQLGKYIYIYKHLAQWSSPMLLRRYLVRAGRSSTARSHQLRQQTKLRPSTGTSSHSAYCHRVYTRRQTNAHEGKMHCIVAILRKRSSFVFPSMKCSVSPRTEQHRSAIWVYCMS